MGLRGISARTDIVALARHDALFMLTSTKSNDRRIGRGAL
jgi:hypothetical protein